MPYFQARMKKAVINAPGSFFFLVITVTSSNITTTAQDLTSASNGRLYIEDIILQTDGTGLAGGTNFQISATNAKGITNFGVETVANLGANATRCLAEAAPNSTNKFQFSVTAQPIMLESGKKLQLNNTVAAGTGAGKVDIIIKFVRIDENAQIAVGSVLS